MEAEKSDLENSLKDRRKDPNPKMKIKALIDEIITSIRQFDEIFKEGTNREKKEFIHQFVDKIELNPEEKRALVHIKRFPAPSSMATGNLSFALVAGARYDHQKEVFPPVEVVEVDLRKGESPSLNGCIKRLFSKPTGGAVMGAKLGTIPVNLL